MMIDLSSKARLCIPKARYARHLRQYLDPYAAFSPPSRAKSKGTARRELNVDSLQQENRHVWDRRTIILTGGSVSTAASERMSERASEPGRRAGT